MTFFRFSAATVASPARAPRRRGVRSFAVSTALLLAFAQAQAATITVNDASSGSVAGKCTLQDAVAAANTNAAVNACTAGSAGADTIVFAPGVTSITLSAKASGCSFGLAVTEDLAIDGGAVPGSGIPKVSIQRSSAAGTPDFGIIGASLYNCGSSPSVKLALTLSGVSIGNANNPLNNGGGVAADVLTVRDSVISGNSAANGGGLYAYTSLAMTSSTVSNNSGGGIQADAPTSISRSTISHNDRGGIVGSGPITIDNSTISGNTNGSGIDTGPIAAYFVTVTANAGPGVTLEVSDLNNALAEFDDSLVAGNAASAPFLHDLETSAARPITGTYNYFGSVSAVGLNDLDNGVRIPTCANLNLGPLANNGGGTQTHALLAGSCLIDAGGIVSPGGFLFGSDQRGPGYLRFVNVRADIGAFEFQGATAPVNGTCGGDNGQILLAAPTNPCSTGSASAIGGNGHPWNWTCNGNNGGGNASCSATIRTWTVTASAGNGGTIAPPTQTVDNGATATLTLSPASGHVAGNASGCGGALNGNTFVTGPVVADCTVTANFAAQPAVSNATPAPALSIPGQLALACALAMCAVTRVRRSRE